MSTLVTAMLGAKVKHKSQPLSGVVVNAYMNHTFMAVMYDVIQEDGTMASIHNSDIGGVELAEASKPVIVNVAAPAAPTTPATTPATINSQTAATNKPAAAK